MESVLPGGLGAAAGAGALEGLVPDMAPNSPTPPVGGGYGGKSPF